MQGKILGNAANGIIEQFKGTVVIYGALRGKVKRKEKEESGWIREAQV